MTVQVGRLDSQTFFSCLVWLFSILYYLFRKGNEKISYHKQAIPIFWYFQAFFYFLSIHWPPRLHAKSGFWQGEKSPYA